MTNTQKDMEVKHVPSKLEEEIRVTNTIMALNLGQSRRESGSKTVADTPVKLVTVVRVVPPVVMPTSATPEDDEVKIVGAKWAGSYAERHRRSYGGRTKVGGNSIRRSEPIVFGESGDEQREQAATRSGVVVSESGQGERDLAATSNGESGEVGVVSELGHGIVEAAATSSSNRVVKRAVVTAFNSWYKSSAGRGHTRSFDFLRYKVDPGVRAGVADLKAGIDTLIRKMSHSMKLLADDLLLTLCENDVDMCYELNQELYGMINSLPAYLLDKPFTLQKLYVVHRLKGVEFRSGSLI